MKSLIIFLLLLMLTGIVMAQDDNDYYGNPPKYPPPFVQQDLDSSHPVVPEPDLDDRPTPGILDDSVTVTTTVPDGAFGGAIDKNSFDQQEPQVIPNGGGSDLAEIENNFLQLEAELKTEVNKSEMKDAASYLPFIQNNRTTQLKSISEGAINMFPDRMRQMRQALNDFRISQNSRIDKFVYDHFYGLLNEKIKEGSIFFNKPRLREISKKDLIENVLLLSHFEGLRTEYTYRNVLTCVKYFNVYVAVGGYFQANQEANGLAYLKKTSLKDNKNVEKILNETDDIMKEMGFYGSFPVNDNNGSKFLFEPIPQEKSVSNSIQPTKTLQSSSLSTTSPASFNNPDDPLAGSGLNYENSQGTPVNNKGTPQPSFYYTPLPNESLEDLPKALK